MVKPTAIVVVDDETKPAPLISNEPFFLSALTKAKEIVGNPHDREDYMVGDDEVVELHGKGKTVLIVPPSMLEDL